MHGQQILYETLEANSTQCPPSSGVPKVVSLKTRLLALQVLGAIMAELADTGAEAQVKCSKVGRLGLVTPLFLCDTGTEIRNMYLINVYPCC